MKASWLTFCLLMLIATALFAVNMSFNTIFASLNSARTSAKLVMHRARLAALTDVPLAWRRVAPPENGLQPKALLVLLHGLNGHPVQLEHMRLRADPAWAVYNPFVHRLGDDRLDFVLRPLKLEIARFIEAHGEAVPIVLAGVSNGARLCGELEVWLRSAATNPVMLSGIAGPFKGTKAVTLMGRLAEKMQIFGADILRELDYKSPTAVRLVGPWLRQHSYADGFTFTARGKTRWSFRLKAQPRKSTRTKRALLSKGTTTAQSQTPWPTTNSGQLLCL